MGPQRSLSSLIQEAHSQTEEVRGAILRLRDANRRLTGSTGEEPTKLGGQSPPPPNTGEVMPLMVALTVAFENLNAATAALRAEVGYLEQTSETGAPTDAENYDKAYNTQAADNYRGPGAVGPLSYGVQGLGVNRG